MKKKPIIITFALSLIAVCGVCTYLIKNDSKKDNIQFENTSTEADNYNTISNGEFTLIKENYDNSKVPVGDVYYTAPVSDTEANEYNTLTNEESVLIKQNYGATAK